MKISIIFFLLIIPLIPCDAAQKAFTIEDLYKIRTLKDVQLSPKGNEVLFVVTEYTLASGESNSDLYLMDSSGKNLQHLTTDSSKDFHPRWSPDGKRILFISERTGVPQIWELRMIDKKRRQITDLSTGVSDAEWSPDGENIAFVSKIFPECGADDECNRNILTSLQRGPLHAHLADELLYRHWDKWKDGRRNHLLLNNIKQEYLYDLTPGDFESPAFSLEGGTGFAFSPDSKEICFVSNRDSNEAETTNKDLWILSIGNGSVNNITDFNEAYDGDPLYSPNGRFIAFRRQIIPVYEADRFRLAVYDRKSKKIQILTEKFDYWVRDFAWSSDSKSLYFTAEVEGHIPLYCIDIGKSKIREVVDAKTIDSFSLSPDNKWIAFIRRSVSEPQEVWRINTNGTGLTRLTYFNKKVEEDVDIRPAEELWIPSKTGRLIHTYLIKPHNFNADKKYPLIINVHGGPQSQWTDAFRGDWQVYPGAGYGVAFFNPHGSTGYGQSLTEAISQDWGGKVYEDVMAVTDSLAQILWIDEARMGAMGWSYGGYMMMWLQGHTHRFKALAAMMGVYNLTSFYGSTEELWFPEWDLRGPPWESPEIYRKWSPHNYVKNFQTPCLVITGEKDFRVSYTLSLEFFTALQKMGVPSRLIVFENDGHWPDYIKSMPFYYNAHLDWFHEYLGGQPAPYNMIDMWRNMAY